MLLLFGARHYLRAFWVAALQWRTGNLNWKICQTTLSELGKLVPIHKNLGGHDPMALRFTICQLLTTCPLKNWQWSLAAATYIRHTLQPFFSIIPLLLKLVIDNCSSLENSSSQTKFMTWDRGWYNQHDTEHNDNVRWHKAKAYLQCGCELYRLERQIFVEIRMNFVST